MSDAQTNEPEMSVRDLDVGAVVAVTTFGRYAEPPDWTRPEHTISGKVTDVRPGDFEFDIEIETVAGDSQPFTVDTVAESVRTTLKNGGGTASQEVEDLKDWTVIDTEEDDTHE